MKRVGLVVLGCNATYFEGVVFPACLHPFFGGNPFDMATSDPAAFTYTVYLFSWEERRLHNFFSAPLSLPMGSHIYFLLCKSMMDVQGASRIGLRNRANL